MIDNSYYQIMKEALMKMWMMDHLYGYLGVFTISFKTKSIVVFRSARQRLNKIFSKPELLVLCVLLRHLRPEWKWKHDYDKTFMRFRWVAAISYIMWAYIFSWNLPLLALVTPIDRDEDKFFFPLISFRWHSVTFVAFTIRRCLHTRRRFALDSGTGWILTAKNVFKRWDGIFLKCNLNRVGAEAESFAITTQSKRTHTRKKIRNCCKDEYHCTTCMSDKVDEHIYSIGTFTVSSY